MSSDAGELHMLFFPFMAQGHMLPLVDMAKLFAAHGARVTVLTTPANAAVIRPTVNSSVHLHSIPFPSAEFGLPEGCENRSFIRSSEDRINFFKAINSLRQPFDVVLGDLRPDCVVSDMFLPWTYHVAAARGIPWLIFHGTNYFSLSATDAFNQYNSSSRSSNSLADTVVALPGLPHRIKMLKTQLMDMKNLAGTPMEFLLELMKEMDEVDRKSFGAVMNSFYELEPDYVDHYHGTMGKKSWSVGPVSLCNEEAAQKTLRGGGQPPASIAESLKWLDAKPTSSVVYVCFGSGSLFTAAQLREMAVGLEASGHPFIWVVRNEGDEWVPAEYEERIRGRGMVMRGWAPQLLILNHGAVGAFVTHCGWNSSMEGICAGLPMVTWPLFAEQFYNERLLVEVLKVGVEVGSKVLSFKEEGRPVVEAAAVEAAVRRVMGDGEEAANRRRRAMELADAARRAVEEGGSSFMAARRLMHELMEWRRKNVQPHLIDELSNLKLEV